MRHSTAKTLATGFVAGMLGFVIISLGFAVLDATSGQGLWFTPSLLSGALFEGVTQSCDVQPTTAGVAAYSALHLVVFQGLGILAAWLFAVTATRPWFWSGAVLLFVVVSFHLYGAVLTILAPVKGCMSLYFVPVVSALAAAAMLGYLVREHRGLRTMLGGDENA